MPRPIWKGHISFGLVNVPVTLYGLEHRNEMSFRLLDSRNNARVRYERVNEITGKEVPWDKIVKAYEYDDNNYVTLTEEDFKAAAQEATQTVEIEDFVSRNDIDIAYYDKPYILVPGKKAEKGYVLLRETLKESSVVGIAQVVIRTRQYLSALVADGDALKLILLRYYPELRKMEEFDLPRGKASEYKITKKETDMAKNLVENMTSEWVPEKYQDEYREKLLSWIEKKIESGGEVTAPEPRKELEPTGEIVDFMELLQRSIQEKKRGRAKASAPRNGGRKRASVKRKTKSKKRSRAS